MSSIYNFYIDDNRLYIVCDPFFNSATANIWSGGGSSGLLHSGGTEMGHFCGMFL